MKQSVKFIGKSLFNQFQPERSAIEKIKFISELPNVVKPCIALPDFHFKKKMEAPSSAAIAVRGCIIPQLSSTSLNCGMGAVVTNLNSDFFSKKKCRLFFSHIKEHKNDSKYDLSNEEVYRILQKGPQALMDRFGINDDIINAFEFNGNMFSDHEVSMNEIKKVIPDGVLDHNVYNGKHELGTGLGGNHFLEVQEVVEIIEPEIAGTHGINTPGQIIVMYHGGGGIISGIIGAYFSRRKKGFSDNWRTNIRRLLYHINRSKLSEIFHIYKNYMSSKEYIAIPYDSPAGHRFAFANNCSMNYGYAYRLFFFIRIRDALAAKFGISVGDISLWRDKSHNSIFQENIADNDSVIMHRHNSCRVEKDELVLLPGYNDTNSYLCIGLSEIEKSYNTIPHGAGDIVKTLRDTGKSKKMEGRSTLLFNGIDDIPVERSHFTGEGVDLVVNTLSDEKILAPVVKLSPLAVLKNFT